MISARNRLLFGLLAFGAAIFVIFYVLSPYVPPDKDQIANVILGNVLGWPAIVLAFFFGTSQSSADKTDALAEMAQETPSGDAADPLHVEVE